MRDRVTHADLVDLTDECLVDRLVEHMDRDARELEAERGDWDDETMGLATEVAWTRDLLRGGC